MATSLLISAAGQEQETCIKMRMINHIMERLKRNVRMIKNNKQYVIADNEPSDVFETLLPDRQIANNLSPTINELGKKLLQAAQVGDVVEIRRLLSKGAPFTADWLGTSPLHLAALNNHLEVCEIFLRAGMCKDTRTKVERTPLHMAVFEGNTEVVKCLLRHGADVDAKDMLHMTPLHWAAQNGFPDIAATLIRYGASTCVTNKFELTPVDIALQTDRSDIVEVINFTTRDPLEATNHLMELNASNDSTEPNIQMSVLEESSNTPDLPIQTVLLDNDDSQDFLQHSQADSEAQEEETDEVQYVESMDEEPNTTFTESMKLLQQHGITMLQEDESNILNSVMESGHSVVLTEAGKQALNSIKAEKLIVEAQPPTKVKAPNSMSQRGVKKRKIITVTADQFLAMTTNNSNSLRIVNGKLVQGKPQAKIIVPKHHKMQLQHIRTGSAPVQGRNETVSDDEGELIEQLARARALAESYRKRLMRTELELQKYKQKCKLLMDHNNLNIL